jgi:hypothetical protein
MPLIVLLRVNLAILPRQPLELIQFSENQVRGDFFQNGYVLSHALMDLIQ